MFEQGGLDGHVFERAVVEQQGLAVEGVFLRVTLARVVHLLLLGLVQELIYLLERVLRNVLHFVALDHPAVEVKEVVQLRVEDLEE